MRMFALCTNSGLIRFGSGAAVLLAVVGQAASAGVTLTDRDVRINTAVRIERPGADVFFGDSGSFTDPVFLRVFGDRAPWAEYALRTANASQSFVDDLTQSGLFDAVNLSYTGSGSTSVFMPVGGDPDILPYAFNRTSSAGSLSVTDRPYVLSYDYDIAINASGIVMDPPGLFPLEAFSSVRTHAIIDINGGAGRIEGWEQDQSGFMSLDQSGQGSAIVLPGQSVSWDFGVYYQQIASYVPASPPLTPVGFPILGGDWDAAHSFGFDLDLNPVTSFGWENTSGGVFGEATNWQYDFLPDTTDVAIFGGGGSSGDADGSSMPAMITTSSTVSFLQAHENKVAQVNGESITFELGGNTYSLNEAGDALQIGLTAGATTLALSNGRVETLGDVVVGAGPGAQATLLLESNATLEVTKALGAVRVGTNSPGVQSGVSSFSVEPGSKVIADILIVAKDGKAIFEDEQIPIQKLAIGSDALTEHPDALGSFSEGVDVLEGGHVFANKIYLGQDADVQVRGAGAKLEAFSFLGGVIDLDRFGTASLTVSDGGNIQTLLMQGNGTVTIESGGVLNAFQHDYGNEAVIGGTGNATIIVQGVGSKLMNVDPATETYGDGIYIGTTADGSLTVRDGALVEGGGIVFGSDNTGNGTGTLEGAGTRAELSVFALADGEDSTADVTISDQAVVQAFYTRLSQGTNSDSTLRIENTAELITNTLDLSGQGAATLRVIGGGVFLPAWNTGPNATGLSVGFDSDTGAGGPAASVVQITGLGAFVTSHEDDIPTNPDVWEAAPVSIVAIGENGRVLVEDFAELKIGTGVIGKVTGEMVPRGGLLRIDNATAEFFGAEVGDTDAVFTPADPDGGHPLRVGAGGTIVAQNLALVRTKDLRVNGGGRVEVDGDLTSWKSTNALINGGLDDQGAFENGLIEITNLALMELNTLDVINGGRVEVTKGGTLKTTMPSVLGGGLFDDLLPPMVVGFHSDAKVILDGTAGGATWEATAIQLGGPGLNPALKGVGGEIKMFGGATITADTIVIKSDGTLTGSGTITTTSSITVEAGGLLAVTRTVVATPPPLLSVVTDSDTTSPLSSSLLGNVLQASLTINGDLILEPGSVLDFEIGGPGPSDIGSLLVTGDATIDGLIQLMFIAGFAPSAGESYELLQIDGLGTIDPNLVTEIVNLDPDFEFVIDVIGGTVMMTAINDGTFVPTPSTAGTLLLLGAGGIVRRCRTSL